VNEGAGGGCDAGEIYSNPVEGNSGITSQGFGAIDFPGGEVQLVSSICKGMCLTVAAAEEVGAVAHLGPCATAAKFKKGV
jgi:hypothetical protein